jgi:uncharacterized protein (DUF983 family)
MIPKGSKLYSILHGVCPHCQEGEIFKSAPYSQLDFTEMNRNCSVCGQAFDPEPDFYQGAMYVSYGLSTGVFLAVGIVMLFYFELGYVITFSAILLVGIVLLPVFFRISRLVWLNLFVSYHPLNK